MKGRNRIATALAAALSAVLASAPVAAQTSYIAPSVSAGLAYDDNPTSSAGDTEGDFILRVSPLLEGGWRGPRGELRALHTFDFERYRDNSRFDDPQIRRRTAVDADYRLSERLDFSGSAATAATDHPGDLEPELGLELGRRDARRHTADAELGYRFTERASGSVAGGWMRSELEGGLETESLLGAVGGAYTASARHTWTADYQFRQYRFGADPEIDAHVGLFGWESALSPRTSLTVQAGPRYVDGETSPEVFVATAYSMAASSLSLNYARSQSAVIGQRGLADSQSAWVTWIHGLTSDLEFHLTPSYSELERGTAATEVLRVAAELRYRMTRNLSLRSSYRWSEQDGRLEAVTPVKITRNVVFVGATWEFNPQPGAAGTVTRRNP